jgi:hypothetical protein
MVTEGIKYQSSQFQYESLVCELSEKLLKDSNLKDFKNLKVFLCRISASDTTHRHTKKEDGKF